MQSKLLPEYIGSCQEKCLMKDTLGWKRSFWKPMHIEPEDTLLGTYRPFGHCTKSPSIEYRLVSSSAASIVNLLRPCTQWNCLIVSRPLNFSGTLPCVCGLEGICKVCPLETMFVSCLIGCDEAWRPRHRSFLRPTLSHCVRTFMWHMLSTTNVRRTKTKCTKNFRIRC